MKNITFLILLNIILGCNNSAQIESGKQQDSIANASDKKVDKIIQNDDSLIKAKEKELLKKYQ